MMMNGSNIFGNWHRWSSARGKASRSFSSRHPITPIKDWQLNIAKVRRVKSTERGSGKGAIRAHLNYLQHKDREHDDDRLVCTVGDLKLIKEWDKIEQHYRVIDTPERGDVLDMERLCEEVCREISKRFGEFRFAGAVHEKMQSSGRLNKHLHLIFRDTMGVGAVALKKAFSVAGAREATLQFERKGLSYLPNGIDIVKKLEREARKLEHELTRGDYVR